MHAWMKKSYDHYVVYFLRPLLTEHFCTKLRTPDDDEVFAAAAAIIIQLPAAASHRGRSLMRVHDFTQVNSPRGKEMLNTFFL